MQAETKWYIVDQDKSQYTTNIRWERRQDRTIYNKPYDMCKQIYGGQVIKRNFKEKEVHNAYWSGSKAVLQKILTQKKVAVAKCAAIV